jgi:site-specific recombinase XerD
MKLLDAFDRFLVHLEHERQCAPGTLVAYRTDFLQFLAWLDRTLELERAGGTKRTLVRPNDLGYLTADRVRGWQASCSIERKIGPAAIRRKLHTLRSFGKFLVRTGALGTDPMAGVTAPKKRKRVRAGLPLEVWRRIMLLELPPREQAMRGVLALAGLRREEVLTLTVGAVRLEPGQAVLLVRGKGDKERLVPVPRPLRELLLDYLLRTGKTGPRERLFTTLDGSPIYPSSFNRTVGRWGKAVGVAVHPHLFRHTYATHLVASGVPIDVVQEWLGHEDLATTAEYLHAAHNRGARAALEGWAESILPKGYVIGSGALQADGVTPREDETEP